MPSCCATGAGADREWRERARWLPCEMAGKFFGLKTRPSRPTFAAGRAGEPHATLGWALGNRRANFALHAYGLWSHRNRYKLTNSSTSTSTSTSALTQSNAGHIASGGARGRPAAAAELAFLACAHFGLGVGRNKDDQQCGQQRRTQRIANARTPGECLPDAATGTIASHRTPQQRYEQ